MTTPARTSHGVGYVRVSTKPQDVDGDSLESQSTSIVAFAKERQIIVEHIHEDVRSGAGADVLNRNEGLRDAVQEARSRGIPLIVTKLDRIARDEATISEIVSSGVVIWSVENGGQLTLTEVLAQAIHAEQAGQLIRAKATLAARRTKRTGVLKPTPAHLQKAQRRGRDRERGRSRYQGRDHGVDPWKS